MTTVGSNKLVPVDVVTASARSGWAPGIDLQFVADPSAGIFLLGDGRGPTYGGHYVPIALDPCVNAIQAALKQGDSCDIRGAMMAGKRIAEEYAARNGAVSSLSSRLFHCTVGISLVVLVGDSLHAAQIGMSRIYLLRGGELRLILMDHSLPSEFARLYGTDSPEYQAAREHRPAITRVLGLSPNVEVDYATEALQDSDQILLCSSGVWNHDQGDEMVRAFMEAPAKAIPSMIEKRALRQGGIDLAVVRFRVQLQISV